MRLTWAIGPLDCGRVVIGSQARLRIWCREAYGFEFLRPHKKVSFGWPFCVDEGTPGAQHPISYMPRGSAPIIPCGSAFRICLFHRQIHGSRRRARARWIVLQYCCPHKKVSFGWPFCVDEGTPGAQHPNLCLGAPPSAKYDNNPYTVPATIDFSDMHKNFTHQMIVIR